MSNFAYLKTDLINTTENDSTEFSAQVSAFVKKTEFRLVKDLDDHGLDEYTNISVSAGVISSHVANPANPAPFFCISSIARVGTNFDLSTPNKSTKLIKKYLIFFCLAI